MYTKEFEGINSFLVGTAQLLLSHGVERISRGMAAVELDAPIIIKINNPRARLVTLKERGWNYVLPYAESLWLASGRNDMNMIGAYLRRMYDFSDDNISMRAGYGPRLRFFSGISDDYRSEFGYEKAGVRGANIVEVDQFSFIEQCFQRDSFTRQAIIAIADPAKDFFDSEFRLKKTKDFPCTTSLQFLRNNDSLDLMIHMRSNDFLWGASAVNIFNFTFIQEYFSKILGLRVGSYYHVVNNLHYYKQFQKRIEALANVGNVKDDFYNYDMSFNNLAEFDKNLSELGRFEESIRFGVEKQIPPFEDDFFLDWAKVIFSFHKTSSNFRFANPILNELICQKHEKINFK